ncbi:MAG: hypothetical protein AABZ06_12540 [Bdellovibrionota bacterium]
MAEAEKVDQWLARTTKNAILGPFNREQICALIRHGELGLQDEVCCGNSYWFYLHEQDEVAMQLGILISNSVASTDEEITETQTKTLLESSDEIAELEEVTPVDNSSTAILGNRALREFQAKSTPAKDTLKLVSPSSAPPPAGEVLLRTSGLPPHVHVLGKIEKPSMWRGFAYVLILSLIFIIYFLLRRLVP